MARKGVSQEIGKWSQQIVTRVIPENASIFYEGFLGIDAPEITHNKLMVIDGAVVIEG